MQITDIFCSDDVKDIQTKLQETFNLIKDKQTYLRKKDFVGNTGNNSFFKYFYITYYFPQDFKVFKNEMIIIQDHIQCLKSQIKSKLGCLQQENIIFEEDIHFYSVKIVDWSAKVKLNEFPTQSQYKQNNNTLKHKVKVSEC